MDLVLEILKQDIDFKDKIQKICLELYNEDVDIYQTESGGQTIFEVHFNDDNFYEIYYSVDKSTDFILAHIQTYIIKERELDLKEENMHLNRNNTRYFSKNTNC